ncbi:MAG: DUF2975 domain-containing protein [Bacteroidales bacterium]|nr:DUF2975 domain-containing protein [Bacteroidales bacterium]
MNQPNKKLIKGIKIFFKIIYIVLIVIFGIEVLSQVIILVLDKDQTGILPLIYSIDQPDLVLNILGKEVKPELLSGIGAVVVKDVPLFLKIINVLFIFTAVAIYILIIKIIRNIIKTIDQNNIFSLLNARRLKKIGFLLVANWILGYAIVYINIFTVMPLKGAAIIPAITISVTESSAQLIAIVFTFFMAAVFKIGVEMEEENKSFV